MTLPLQVDFWNMPPDPDIEVAAQNEANSLECENPITSCRVTVTRGDGCYAVQIVVLAGSKMLRFERDSRLCRIMRWARARLDQKGRARRGRRPFSTTPSLRFTLNFTSLTRTT
jgi:hypothetical protein